MTDQIAIIESFIRGKSSQESCEDALVITDDFIAVIDGVTSKTAFTHGRRTTGKIASGIVQEAIQQADPNAGFTDILASINRGFASFYDDVDFPGDPASQGPQAMAAIYSVRERTIWMVGDCQVSVDGTTYLNVKPSDEILAKMRSLAITIMLEERGLRDDATTDPEDPTVLLGTHDPAREVILPWILRSTVFANNADTPFGYSVFNGQPIPMQLVKTIKLDRLPSQTPASTFHTEHEIVLASDGYPLAKAEQSEQGVSSLQDGVGAFQDAVGVRRHLRYLPPTLSQAERVLAAALKEDPYCCHANVSTKGLQPGQRSFDDRAYVRFRIDSDL